MLVLSRRLGEMIRIGDDIKVVILEVRLGQVKLGIDAPEEIKVHREEVYQRILAEQVDPPAPRETRLRRLFPHIAPNRQ